MWCGEGWYIISGFEGGGSGKVKPALWVFLCETFNLFNTLDISSSKLPVGNKGPSLLYVLFCLLVGNLGSLVNIHNFN